MCRGSLNSAAERTVCIYSNEWWSRVKIPPTWDSKAGSCRWTTPPWTDEQCVAAGPAAWVGDDCISHYYDCLWSNIVHLLSPTHTAHEWKPTLPAGFHLWLIVYFKICKIVPAVCIQSPKEQQQLPLISSVQCPHLYEVKRAFIMAVDKTCRLCIHWFLPECNNAWSTVCVASQTDSPACFATITWIFSEIIDSCFLQFQQLVVKDRGRLWLWEINNG